MPNTHINNYYIKAEHLTSAYNQFKTICKNEQSYFVTVQPNKQIWSIQDATDYLNELLPNRPPLLLALEYNDQISHKQNSRHYHLLPTLHLHLIISEQYVTQLPNVIIYNNERDLSQKKKALKQSQLHITARKVFSDDWQSYVLKQTSNLFKPLLINNSVALPFSTIYNKKEMEQTTQSINPIYLLQLITSGCTYSQIKAEQYKQKRKEKRKKRTLQVRVLSHLRSIKHKYLLLNAEVYKERSNRLILPKPPPLLHLLTI